MPRRDDDDDDDFDRDRDDDVDVSRKKRKGGSSAAAGRLAGPAISLLVCGILWVVLSCLSVPLNIYMATQPRPVVIQGDFNAQMQSNPIGSAIYYFVQLLVSGFIIFGAIQMKNGKMYGVSMATAILSVIPCCSSPCLCLGMPFGIWALVVLMDEQVKQSFTS